MQVSPPRLHLAGLPEGLHKHFADVPTEEMRLMIAGNAARLYNL
jgi:hypothetical protein